MPTEYQQWKQYKWPIGQEQKAAQKQQQLKDAYGYTIPVYKIQNPSGKQWLAMTYPEGLQPKSRRRPRQF
jgi:hypothetical protein